MDKNRVIEKLSWIFQSSLSIPGPITNDFKEEQYRFFENYVHFLQDNGFTTKEILKKGERANDDSQITRGDLTEEGFKFYPFGIRKWRERYDKAKDKDKAINDFGFIEKKLLEFRKKQK
ncbi:MAG: cyclopropane-fatty-acyl-phospholipid synthase [Chitinophagaceae bacterium]|nr:cyclopropane-fatty-acyl-phospholipid synthase [Chitinophagaceae bacterium]